MTSSLSDRYINDLQPGSIVLKNLGLVRWVTMKNSYDWEKSDARNKPITKLTKLCNNLTNWINKYEVQKTIQNVFKGNRLIKENDMLQSLIKLFDQDLKLVKEHVLNNFTKNYNDIDRTHVKVQEILIRTSNDNAPIDINFDVGLPIAIY